MEGEPLTCTAAIEHEINTRADSAPVNVRPYRLPEKHKNEVNRQITEMLKAEIIRPSASQWNAPLLVVPKKADASGKPKLRVVIDFRKLNDLTIGDSFPLPNITDIRSIKERQIFHDARLGVRLSSNPDDRTR